MVHAAMEQVPDDGETSPGFECRLERERARSGEYFGLWAVALDSSSLPHALETALLRRRSGLTLVVAAAPRAAPPRSS